MNTMKNVMELINNAWEQEGSDLRTTLTSKSVNGQKVEGLRITNLQNLKESSPKHRIEPVIYPEVNNRIEEIKRLCEIAYEDTKTRDIKIPEITKGLVLKRVYVDVSSKTNLESFREHDHVIVICSEIDMIIRFRILFESKENEFGTSNATAIVTNNLMKGLNISEEELLKAAISNTSNVATVTSLFEAIKELSPIDTIEFPDQPLMVAKTANDVCGAGVIACKDFLHFIHERVGDYYILPSSIHEILILPTKHFIGASVEDLRNMVMDVNNTAVSPEDKLTDNVYIVKTTKEGLDLQIA